MRCWPPGASIPGRMASERRSETSRLEGFSDAVFAFALTLLVVSLQVPSSYDELVHTLRSFVAFAPSFAALIWIWYLHREFFRRYGLGDGPMVFLCRRAPLERNARLTRDVAQLIDNRHDKRDPLAAADRFGFALRIARDQRPRGPGRGPCLP